MNAPTLTCHDERRRHAVRHRDWNGLDYLEIGPDQLTLEVFFLGHAPEDIRPENFRIDAGRRIRDIRITDLRVYRRDDPELDDCVVLTVDRAGDFSIYTLRVVAVDKDGRPTGEPMPDFDPRYDRLEFSFKTDCPSELDCAADKVCPDPAHPTPEISYLAKDYASFRRLALDRLATVMPDWQERHVPDLGIALVELMAYTADHLSYYQDAVATEAYLATARQRASLRRHARLVDYQVHEGNNSRAWVTLEVGSESLTLPPEGFAPGAFEFYLITSFEGIAPSGTVLTEDELPAETPRPYEVFEPLVVFWRKPIELRSAQNRISFYTWGDRQCCLPRGATRATLIDPWLPPPQPAKEESPVEEPYAEQEAKQQPPDDEHCDDEPPVPPKPRCALALAPGDVLIFEEVLGPESGEAADADPSHRHAVRLTRADCSVDPLSGQPIVEIGWHEDDALPFPLCISAVGRPPDCDLLEDVSVARGNVVPVDHGRRVEDEILDPVPETVRRLGCEGEGRPIERQTFYPRYRPKLDYPPLVFAEPYAPRDPACAAIDQDPRRALPWIELAAGKLDATGDFVPGSRWAARRDLLASDADDHHFVAEVDNEGHACLRFGDGELGARPPAGGVFRATYRVAPGPRGNVGAEMITHLVLRRGKLEGETIAARNPLSASGGTAPEPLADVRRLAGYVFRSDLERAVTAEDYARLAEEHPGVQRAAARLRWSGCSYKVLVAVDARGSTEAEDELLREIAAHLAPYRRMGHEVLVGRAEYVPLEIQLVVCVEPDHLRGRVLAGLSERLSNRLLPDGSRGFFHPDELSFGDGIYLSELVAAAQLITGVGNVPIDPAGTRFRRYGEAANGEIESGFLPLGAFEIARLDNDPSFPENGVLKLDLRGGR